MTAESGFKISVTGVVSATRLFHSPVNVTTRREHRPRWAVILKQGMTYYNVDGERVLSDERHPILLGKGSHYEWTCVEPGECLILEFDAAEESDAVYSFEVADAAFITEAFARIEKCLSFPGPESDLECKAVLYGVLLALLRSVPKAYMPREKREILRPAVEYMAAHYRDGSVTNETLAKKCGVSTVHFRKVFTKVYGISPIKYLHRFRIRQAKAILTSDYGSIKEVAESVGYNSIYHFSKMFRTYTGKSPTEYARSVRAGR